MVELYAKILVPSITKRFKSDEQVTYLVNGSKLFAPFYLTNDKVCLTKKLEHQEIFNLQDSYIIKFRIISTQENRQLSLSIQLFILF